MQWWCTHDETGKLRDKPYSTSMATSDALDKLVLFWEWVSRGLPGWYKGPRTLVSRWLGGHDAMMVLQWLPLRVAGLMAAAPVCSRS